MRVVANGALANRLILTPPSASEARDETQGRQCHLGHAQGAADTFDGFTPDLISLNFDPARLRPASKQSQNDGNQQVDTTENARCDKIRLIQVVADFIPGRDVREHQHAQYEHQRKKAKDDARCNTRCHTAQANTFGLRRDPCQPKRAHRSAHHSTDDPPDSSGYHDRDQGLIFDAP